MPSKRVAALMERFYGQQTNGTIEFRDLITAQLKPDHIVLDLGCGTGREEMDFRDQCELVVGCDYTDAVSRNQHVSARLRGDAYELPFADEVFDAVIMDFVLEHLEFGDKAAAEISRVLKFAGSLFFRTPNSYHYVTLISRLTPHSFHERVVRKLAGSAEAESFQTFYRLNTRHDVRQVFSRAGLDPAEIRMVEKEPYYLSFAAPAFLLGCCYERVVNKFESLSGMRSNIFGYLRKVHSAQNRN
jgi:ubiquinone/menaquinone biosynthesis C-methylase UbiE